MPRKADSRRSQTARSGSSSHHVVNVEMTDGSSAGSANGIGFCIFRVPQSLSEINQMAYQPNTVPIGPYHHGKPQFQKIQEHKQRFSLDLLNRTNQKRDKLKHFAEALKPTEEKIRKCYSEALAFKSDELIEMMVLDGCFIIELFCKYYRKLARHTDPGHDPLLTEPWVLPFLMRDLAKLENQIPWFVLQRLFDLTLGCWNESHPSLSDLALSFFNRMVQRPDNDLKKYSDWEGEHLLNFLRLTNNPDSPETKQKPNKFLRLIQPANKLHQAGIKFKPTHCASFMDIKFSNGVLEIPDVNTYIEKDWRVHWASFKNTYFSSRWSLISAVAAFLLLALAAIQSFFAVRTYYQPQSSPNPSSPNHQ
ncbi:hypothetical protein NL676_001628 [Syzygium grande]|nr:hypothetical protein NL676_001628 [Syzygium grande]